MLQRRRAREPASGLSLACEGGENTTIPPTSRINDTVGEINEWSLTQGEDRVQAGKKTECRHIGLG